VKRDARRSLLLAVASALLLLGFVSPAGSTTAAAPASAAGLSLAAAAPYALLPAGRSLSSVGAAAGRDLSPSLHGYVPGHIRIGAADAAPAHATAASSAAARPAASAPQRAPPTHR
jgi:hypothetical protein